MNVIIERLDGARPVWLCEKLGRDWGAGRFGGWTDEREKATVYKRGEAEEHLAGALMHMAPYCKVVAR